jgi:acetyltransferase-like isoleucine patch superfamily enzyme
MVAIEYLFSKLLKKMRGRTIFNSSIDSTSKLEAGSAIVNSTLGKHSFCGYDCSIINCAIGSFCSIASGVTIGGLGHPMNFVSTSPVFLAHKDSVKAKFSRHEYLVNVTTFIGNDVWIGERALLKAGVHVGHGAVIGMGSVVTKNVTPYSVVAGNPARLIRMRFSEEIIGTLLEYQWWNLPDEQLRTMAPSFNDMSRFLEIISESAIQK